MAEVCTGKYGVWQYKTCGNGCKGRTSKYSMACGNIRHVAMGAEMDAGKYGVRQYKTCGNGSRLQR